jgi:hypothetical protein
VAKAIAEQLQAVPSRHAFGSRRGKQQTPM